MSWKDINSRICFMPSDGSGGEAGGDGPGGDGEGVGGEEDEDAYYGAEETPDLNDLNDVLGPEDEDLWDGDFEDEERGGDTLEGISSDGTRTYSTKIGILGYEIDIDRHTSKGGALGAGTDFSFADEIAADVLEVMGFEVTDLNVDIAQDVAAILIGFVLGVPVSTLAIKSAKLAANVAQSTGAISEETNDQIQFGLAVVEFMQGAKTTMDMTSTLMEYSEYMTTTGKLAAFAVESVALYSTYEQFMDLQEKAKELGVNINDINQSDLNGFDRESERDGTGYGSRTVEQSFTELVKWKVLNDINIGKNPVIDASDIFDIMAGGVLYNAFFGGGIYFHPANPRDQNLASVGHGLVFDDIAKMSMMGEDFIFSQNTKNASSSSDSDSASPLEVAKASIYRRLQGMQEDISTLIDSYNTEVALYNAHTTGFDYSVSKTKLEDIEKRITLASDEFSVLAEKI